MDLTPKFNEEWIEEITLFIKSHVEEAGAKGVVIGLSGGLDSSVVAKLCVLALGKKNVVACYMPAENIQREEEKDAFEIARMLGIKIMKLDITKILDAMKSTSDVSNKKEVLGNAKARARMLLLYTYANRENLLVAGTSNKSELLTGYFTKFGDGGADITPIGDLYKTQVRELAKHLKISKKIISKTPTAGLWKGQTDEKELGITYELLDKILYSIELGLNEGEIAEICETKPSKIRYVENMIHRSIHKRKFPRIPKIGIRTVGVDLRET
ncbi:MAG: NAD+ synthase [Thermoplasmata archaeon]